MNPAVRGVVLRVTFAPGEPGRLRFEVGGEVSEWSLDLEHAGNQITADGAAVAPRELLGWLGTHRCRVAAYGLASGAWVVKFITGEA